MRIFISMIVICMLLAAKWLISLLSQIHNVFAIKLYTAENSFRQQNNQSK